MIFISKGGYSLKEKCIGTWINGKPLYRKELFYKNPSITDCPSGTQSYQVCNFPLEEGITVTNISNIYILNHRSNNIDVAIFGRYIGASVTYDNKTINIFLQNLFNSSVIPEGSTMDDITLTMEYTKNNE